MDRIFSPLLIMGLALAILSACTTTSSKSVGQAFAEQGSNPRGECMVITDDSEDSSKSQTVTLADSIQLLKITPPEGTKVGKPTILQIDLAYTVKDFEAEKYSVLVQFDTTQRATTDGTFPRYPYLRSARGKIHYCFPLADVWDRPDLKKPLSVHFFLNRDTEPGHSRVIAQIAPIAFPN